MSALTLPRIFGPQLSSTKPVCIEKIAFLYIKIKMWEKWTIIVEIGKCWFFHSLALWDLCLLFLFFRQHQRFPRRDLSVAFFRIQPKVFVGFKVVIFMNFAVLLGLLCLPACHCLNGKGNVCCYTVAQKRKMQKFVHILIFLQRRLIQK